MEGGQWSGRGRRIASCEYLSLDTHWLCVLMGFSTGIETVDVQRLTFTSTFIFLGLCLLLMAPVDVFGTHTMLHADILFIPWLVSYPCFFAYALALAFYFHPQPLVVSLTSRWSQSWFFMQASTHFDYRLSPSSWTSLCLSYLISVYPLKPRLSVQASEVWPGVRRVQEM